MLHLLLQAGFLIAVILLVIQSARYLWERIKPSRTQLPQLHYKPPSKISSSSQTKSTNRRLQRELLTLLRGDTATVQRLLKQQQQLHPGESENWYLEKVIYDLERDRHC